MSSEDLKKEIDSIAGQLVAKYHAQKIILFGSAARGNYGPDSDLDFLVVKDDVPLLGRERMREVRKMIESHLPVDYLIFKNEELENRLRMGDPFLKGIFTEGKVLYG